MNDLPAREVRTYGAARFTLKAVAIGAVFFIGILPTLSWLEFSSGSENLVVETVLEMHRGGPWLIPTLKGAPRTAKPPLTSWISAALLKPSTVTALADTGERRERAYHALAREIRWPALLFACLTLVGCAWLGRVTFDDDTIGLAAAAMMGSSLLFLRFGRTMTTDVQLALWVTLANVFFAVALLRGGGGGGRAWMACIGGGVALGLALMSKGPVAFAQTVAPFAVVALWNRWRPPPQIGEPMRRVAAWPPIVAGGIVTLAIALPWPIWALTRLPGQLTFWWNELARGGTREEFSTDPPWTYLALIPLLLPWAGLFFLGMVDLFRRQTVAARVTIALVLVPVVIMTCFKEKNERYLLPMLAPAAVVCAVGLVRREDDLEPVRKWVIDFTWCALAAIVIGLPVAGAIFLKKLDQSPYWSLPTGLMLAAGGAAVLIVAWRMGRTCRRRYVVIVGALLMIAAQALLMYGYRDSKNGRSDAKPLADAIVNVLGPDADVQTFVSPGRFFRVPVDFVIYLNDTTSQVTDPTTLPSIAPKPRVIIVHCRKATDWPAELSGWRVIGQVSKNYGTWYACVPPS